MKTEQAALIVSGIAAAFSLYGASGAHRALRWQKRRDRQRRKIRTRLEVLQQISIEGPSDSYDDALRARFRLVLSAVNASEEAVIYVRSLILADADGNGIVLLHEEQDDVRLEPHERVAREVAFSELDMQRFDPTIEGIAVLTSGERFVVREPLDKSVLDLVASAHQQFASGRPLRLEGDLPDAPEGRRGRRPG